jgi:putative SOS response-associated peptidase YedK
MCGRFALYSSGEQIAEAFDLAEVPELFPRYNISPTNTVPVVRTCRPRADRQNGGKKRA